MDGPPRPGRLIDVSEGGLAFQAMHAGPATGDVLNLALSVRGDVVLDMRGRVVQAGEERVSATFLGLDPADRVILRQFVGRGV